MTLPSHAPRALFVRFTSFSNEGHFSLDEEKVCRPRLSTHCRGVTQIRHMALSPHALQPDQVRLKPVSKEGHIPLEAEEFIVRSSPRIAVGSLREATKQKQRMPN
jgi:hypothetical protein